MLVELLAAYVADVASRPLDPGRPLWEMHVVEGLDHVGGGQVPCFHLLRLEVDEDGAILAADDHGSDAALDRPEHVAHLDAGHVLDVGLAEAVVADREHAQRHGGGGVEGEHRPPVVVSGEARRHPEDQAADLPMRLLAAEVTREQVFLQLHQELPYEAAVETEKWEERSDTSVRIEQTIHVQRDGQRAIVLGKGGARIKQIGARARLELSRLLERPVHLFLHVKVSERWADDPAHYRAIGLEYEP